MNIGSTVASSAGSNANVQDNYSVSVAKKALDVTKQQGDEAVSLIDSAASDSTPVGHNLNTKA